MARDGGGADGGRVDPLARALDRLVAEAAAADAARDRLQERTLRSVAEAEATFVGVAVDLAEQGAEVVVRLAGGRSHRGRITAVGRDLLIVRDGDRPPAVVATVAVTALRPVVDGPPHVRDRGGDAAGGRPAPAAAGLVGLLSELAAERPQVHVGLAGDDPLTGVLRSVGVDVLTVRLDAERRPVVHVRLGAVTDVVLLDL